MTVGDEVRSSLDHWSVGEWRQAMWHATAALEETADKRYPALPRASQFKRTVRDDVDIFGAMAAPDIDFVSSRFPVPVASDTADGRPDIADVLFGMHRFLRGHTDEMPAGCEVVAPAQGVSMFEISHGRMWLRASAVLGLLGIVVFSSENADEIIPPQYQLGWQHHVFHVSGWWGWQSHFRDIVARGAIPKFTLDFGSEWDAWGPVSG
ncbi:MAG: hypothetical protein ACR2JM_05135 [Mycobacterium sp.]